MPDRKTLPIDTLRTRRFFGFCGIAGPQTLRAELESFGPTFAGLRAFGDHHAYSAEDLRRISAKASTLGAELLVTTEKDWVKVTSIVADNLLPIATLELQIHFRDGGDEALLRQIMESLSAPPPAGSADRAQAGRAS
jgi:tetraacyldisaccharide 4'-kinase